ncbi:MAG: type 1 glutamine amidotransferase [Hyphomonadaceae bacterium]
MRTIGILQTGAPPGDLSARFDPYGVMFQELLGQSFAYRVYDVQTGDMPAGVDAAQGWLITGSPSGVYDGDGWIADLKSFVQRAAGTAPMVGVCFGHQLMGEAFGGEVIKSPKGFGIGLHRYEIEKQAAWMDSTAPVALPVSHQDQVVALGPGAERLGASAFTPNAILHYPALKAFTVQGHPEFDPTFSRALIASRRGLRYSEEAADAAIATLAGADDRARVGGWIADFLNS